MAPLFPSFLVLLVVSVALAYASCIYRSESSFKLLLLYYVSVLLALKFTWDHVVHPKFLSPLRDLPEIKSHIPWYGHGLKHFKFPMGSFSLQAMNTIPNDGLIRFTMLGKERLIATKPHTIAEVTQKLHDFEKPAAVRDTVSMFFGRGLLNAEGDVHKFQRKKALPAFTVRAIRDLGRTFWSKANQLVDVLANEIARRPQAETAEDGGATFKARTGVVDMSVWTTSTTLDIISLACLGWDLNTLTKKTSELVESYAELTEPSPGKALWDVMHILGFGKYLRMLPLRVTRHFRFHSARLRSTVGRFVQEKKAQLKADVGREGERHVDILSMLIRTGDFSDPELEDLMLNFFTAGHETTAATFSWLIYSLARDLPLQARLRAELRAALPARSSPSFPTNPSEALESLPLLNAVLAETLRLYPAVPLLSRTPVAGRTATVGGYAVPPGCRVVLSPWAVNRCVATWGPDAGEFRPGRWLVQEDEDGEGGGALRARTTPGGVSREGSGFDLMTFNHGLRSCIGQGFARAELRALVAAFVCAFEWEMAREGEELEAVGVVVAKPKGGVHVRLRRLEDW